MEERTPEAQMVSKDSPEAPESHPALKAGRSPFTDSGRISEDIGKSLASDAGPLAVSYPVPLHLLPSVLFSTIPSASSKVLSHSSRHSSSLLQTFIVTDENSSPRHGSSRR